MELRKVQLTGGSSLTVTLPKAWVDKVQVQAGDVVGFQEQPDGSLAVHPHAKGDRDVETFRIDADDVDREQLFRSIVSAYLMGYDAVRVDAKKGLSAGARRSVRDAVRRIVGLEVVEEGPDAVTIQDLLDPKDFHMDKALRRMAMLTDAMQREAVEALRGPDPDADVVRSVEDYDDEVDRLYWLVNKQFHALLRDASYAAKMEVTPSQAVNFLLLARVVERTADHAARIAHQAVELERTEAAERLAERLADQFDRAQELFGASMDTFFRHDGEAAGKLIDEIDAFLPTQEELLKDIARLGGEKVTHLAFVLESVGRTAAYAEDVAEVAINHEVASAGKGR